VVVLFGSVGRGESDEQSDTDILVVLKNGGNKLRGEISMAMFSYFHSLLSPPHHHYSMGIINPAVALNSRLGIIKPLPIGR
jgi:predicted nucleotidyltransferase